MSVRFVIVHDSSPLKSLPLMARRWIVILNVGVGNAAVVYAESDYFGQCIQFGEYVSAVDSVTLLCRAIAGS